MPRKLRTKHPRAPKLSVRVKWSKQGRIEVYFNLEPPKRPSRWATFANMQEIRDCIPQLWRLNDTFEGRKILTDLPIALLEFEQSNGLNTMNIHESHKPIEFNTHLKNPKAYPDDDE